MKKKLFACLLAVTLVAALVFVVAPTAKADPVIVQAENNKFPEGFDFNNILDLNGQNVTVELTNGETLKVINTSFITGEGLQLDGEHPGSLTVTGNGTVAKVTAVEDGFRYLAVQDGDTYTFHPFNLAITRLGLNTLGKDGTNPAVCVEAVFLANNVVKTKLEAEGSDYGLQKPSDEGEVTFSAKANNYTFSETNGVQAYYDLADSLTANIDNTYELQAYMVIDGVKITNKSLPIIPREVLKLVNKAISDPATIITEKQAATIKELMGSNTRLNNIFTCYWGDGDTCKHGAYDADWKCLDCDKDTSAYQLTNGGFENGLEGWKVVGNIGDVSTDTHYWTNENGGYAFGMDGEKMFSAYAPGAAEAAVGTLTSPTFTVGGSGFVTFKVGAMKDGNYVYVDVVDAETKEILARYYNGDWSEYTAEAKSGCTLIAYKADLSTFRGKEVYFRISDNAMEDYGLFFADSFVTYYEEEPVDFNVATPVNYTVSGTIYDLFNGGFELGGEQGWWNIGEIGVVTNANGYWGDNIPYNKDGDYLFTGVESFGANTMREGNRGTLTSSVFEIGGTGWISFKLGGGGNALCYVQVIDSTTGEILARYHQQEQQDAKLIQYVANLSAYIGKTARIQVVDYASEGWGCVSFDSVKTYYASTNDLPGDVTANNIFHGVYNVANGSFETGNLEGWQMHIWEPGAHNTLGYIVSEEHFADWYISNDNRKDGNFLMTFVKRGDVENCENTKGELVSSTFTLKQNGFISFRFGAAHKDEVRIELVRADGEVIARFYNRPDGRANTEMYAYFYQYTGETTDCFFRVVDDANAGPYGCFVVDDFRVNLESVPEGFIPAIQ